MISSTTTDTRGPRRRTRAVITTAAALVAAAAFAVPANANLGAFGPLAPVGFPSYYEDAQGVQLGLCIDDARCPSAPQKLEPVAPNDEAFYFIAASGVSGNGATVDVEFAVEAAYLDPETPITFGRIQFTAKGLRPNTEYTVEHPWGTSHFTTEPDGTLLGGKRAAQREETDGTFADTLTTSIGPWLRSDAAPAGYLGDGITSTTVTGGPLRNSIRVFGPGLPDEVTDGTGLIVQPAGLISDQFTVEGKLFDPNAPLPPATVPVPPDTDKDGVIDSVDNCLNQQGPASNNGCPPPVIIDNTKPTPPAAASAAAPAPPQVVTNTIIQRVPVAGATIASTPSNAGVLGTTARSLKVSRLSVASRLTRARLRAQGLRATMSLQEGTGVVRIGIYRARNGKKSGRALFTAFRVPRSSGLYQVVLRNRSLISELRRGSYIMEVRAGLGRASLGRVTRRSFRVIR